MPIVLETLCKGCSENNCGDHQVLKYVIDKITNLEVEARCMCNNCKIGGKSDDST